MISRMSTSSLHLLRQVPLAMASGALGWSTVRSHAALDWQLWSVKNRIQANKQFIDAFSVSRYYVDLVKWLGHLLQHPSPLRRLVSNLSSAAQNTALGLLTWVKLTLDILVKIRFISSLFMIFNSIIVMATKVVQEWIFVVISACSCHSKSHLGLWAPRHLKTQN